MEELERLRKTIRGIYFFGLIILILVIIVVTGIIQNVVLAPFILIIGVLIIEIAVAGQRKKYRKLFKEEFVVKALEKIFTDLYYNSEEGIPYSTIAGTRMMYMGDIYKSEDYVSGKYKDINFEQSDVHIEERQETTDSDGHTTTTYVTIFKGRWMVFDFNKEFKANVQISQKGFANSRVKRFFGKKEELFKKVSMESESFNKKFNVFAQNEHDAFYIITPTLMERLENLVNNNKGKMLFCFINNKLHIGINDYKDSFEPGSVFKKLNEEEIVKKVSREIETITQFVDELNLDNDLFRREV